MKSLLEALFPHVNTYRAELWIIPISDCRATPQSVKTTARPTGIKTRAKPQQSLHEMGFEEGRIDV
jgi:hypothetical protein